MDAFSDDVLKHHRAAGKERGARGIRYRGAAGHGKAAEGVYEAVHQLKNDASEPAEKVHNCSDHSPPLITSTGTAPSVYRQFLR